MPTLSQFFNKGGLASSALNADSAPVGTFTYLGAVFVTVPDVVLTSALLSPLMSFMTTLLAACGGLLIRIKEVAYVEI